MLLPVAAPTELTVLGIEEDHLNAGPAAIRELQQILRAISVRSLLRTPSPCTI